MNSIIWGNGSPVTYAEIVPDCTAGARVEYSNIMGGGGCDIWPGNIDSNPWFVFGSYSLQSHSPCIDAAHPSYAPEKDILGMYRDDEPDMGAYEYFPVDEEE